MSILRGPPVVRGADFGNPCSKLKLYSGLLNKQNSRHFRSAFLNPNYSEPVFYHKLGRGRKAILYGSSLLGQFYLPPSNKKGPKVFKKCRYYIIYKIPYTLTIKAHFVFLGKSYDPLEIFHDPLLGRNPSVEKPCFRSIVIVLLVFFF